MKEYKVGEIFEHDGKVFQCVEDSTEVGCGSCCALRGKCEECVCSSEERQDEANVHFICVTELREGMLFRAKSGELYRIAADLKDGEKCVCETGNRYSCSDIKGQIRYPLTFREVLPYILGGQLAAVLIILAVCLILMARKKKGYEEAHRDPAHIVALRKLDGFRGDRLWVPEKQKTFYSGVTDALREYIVARYGISAMEMTTKEIFDDLKGTDVPPELFAELKSLFERADYVKFAKYVATEAENASAVPLAVRFVTTTYQTEVNADSADSSSGHPDSSSGNPEPAGESATVTETASGPETAKEAMAAVPDKNVN